MADPNRVIQVLRAQAWERAKGELQAMLNTFYATDEGNCRPGQFNALDNAINLFVNHVESEGLEE